MFTHTLGTSFKSFPRRCRRISWPLLKHGLTCFAPSPPMPTHKIASVPYILDTSSKSFPRPCLGRRMAESPQIHRQVPTAAHHRRRLRPGIWYTRSGKARQGGKGLAILRSMRPLSFRCESVKALQRPCSCLANEIWQSRSQGGLLRFRRFRADPRMAFRKHVLYSALWLPAISRTPSLESTNQKEHVKGKPILLLSS